MLGVNTIPCIVVVNNSTGRVVTDYGLQSIENHFYGEPMEAIYAWRKKSFGVISHESSSGILCIVLANVAVLYLSI